jgi:hypothetical protein
MVQPGWRGTGAAGIASGLAEDEVLVVSYMSEAQGKHLQGQDTYYLNRAGNAWLTNTAHSLAVLVQGKPRPREALAVAGGQVFSKTGIRLLYALLSESKLCASRIELSRHARNYQWPR